MNPLPSQKEQVFSVTDLTLALKRKIESEFVGISVQGEVSSFTKATSGHCYFNLKDSNSIIACALFKFAATKVKFPLQEGIEIVAQGKISVYAPRGTYQLIVENVKPIGQGDLHLAFEKLKEKLAKEGLFSEEKKKKIPNFPKKIGIVTSEKGAVIQDILNVIQRRFPNIHLILNPVKVQGKGAAKEIGDAIEWFVREEKPDLLIVGRGGGSLEDLWEFNEESLARVAFACPIPIISAVGHETDFSIFDFVADLRAPTPSAAAELAVPVKTEWSIYIQELQIRLNRALLNQVRYHWMTLETIRAKLRSPSYVLEHFMQNLDEMRIIQNQAITTKIQQNKSEHQNLKQKLSFVSPKVKILSDSKQLENLQTKIIFSFQNWLKTKHHFLAEYATKLDALSPLKTMKRGFTMAVDKRGKNVQSIHHFKIGDVLHTKFVDGKLISRIEKIEPNSKQVQLNWEDEES